MRDGGSDAEIAGQIGEKEGRVRACITSHELAEGIGDGFEEGGRQAYRQCHAQRVAQPGGVLSHGIP